MYSMTHLFYVLQNASEIVVNTYVSRTTKITSHSSKEKNCSALCCKLSAAVGTNVRVQYALLLYKERA